MNKIEKIKIISNHDNLELSIVIVIPDDESKIKGIVQISHGMSEHKERYLEFMNYLANNSYIAIINDHRGHGESVKGKEDLGYFYENGAIGIVEDLHQITEYIKERYSNLPLYLFGHSMGSLIVRAYTKKYDYELSGLIVCGSPSKNKMAKMGKILVKMMTLVKGDKYRSKLIDDMAFKGNNDKFEPKKTKNDWLCSVEQEVDKYSKDEYCGRIFTLNGFNNLFTLMIEVYNNEGWIRKNAALPILFIAGEDDPVIINKAKFENAYNFMINLGYNNVKNKLYKGKRHEILNEDIKEEVYNDVLNFVNENNK